MKGRPQLRDVARRAGVGPSSVSRVLSGHPDVSEQMRTVVMAAVDELGYQPDLLARGLRSGRTGTVGFVVSDIANPMVAQAVTGAERRLRQAGYSMLLTNSEGSVAQDPGRIALLLQRSVDGLLLLLTDETDAATVEALADAERPIVLLDREPPARIEAARVWFDHRTGMAAAARALLDHGHRRIVLISGGPRRPMAERRAGVEEALAAVADAELSVLVGDLTIAAGEAMADRVLAMSPRPTAVVAAGNVFCEGALLVFRRAGVRVPEDISLVGCDDSPAAVLHQPPIAVVSRDMRAFGLFAAELLLAALEGRRSIDQVVLPTEFVDRPSIADVSKQYSRN